jgi:hypothetical protein
MKPSNIPRLEIVLMLLGSFRHSMHRFPSIHLIPDRVVLGRMLHAIKQFFLDLEKVWLAYAVVTSIALLLAMIL